MVLAPHAKPRPQITPDTPPKANNTSKGHSDGPQASAAAPAASATRAVAGIGINSCVSQAGECGSCGKDEQCRSGRCAGGRCITAGSVVVGATGCKNEQCTSGACNTNGRCQCTEDRHYPTGQTCDKGGALGIGVNTCVRKVGICESCGKDTDCQSNNCKSGRCVVENTLAMGATCCRDAQCRSGSCNNVGQCQCTKDGDCPGNQKCKKGFLGIGRNECK